MAQSETEELKEVFLKFSRKVIRLIPYLTILSGMMIWSYLNNIGRLDLLMDSFSINIGLISLLISIVFLSLAIAITLVLPSSILIFHYSIAPSVIKKPMFIPLLGCVLSVLFLMLTFLPHAPFMKKIMLPPPASFVMGTVAVICFAFFMSISLLNGDFKVNGFLKKTGKFCKVLFETYTLSFATLSVSIPVGLLLKNSTAEKTISLLIALVFMSAFALLAFFPAMIYYREIKEASLNDENRRFIPVAKKISIALIITIVGISFLFPNLITLLTNTSLHSIGMIDDNNHHFMINGDKYQKDMFPEHIWMTSTTDGIEKNFFIYGIRMFSVGNKKLICPGSVGDFKKSISGTNYDLITSSYYDDKPQKLKDMTDICVVFTDDDARQWDTLFENDNKNR